MGPRTTDGVLLDWGTRLFYPECWRPGEDQTRLPRSAFGAGPSARAVRARIRATVRRTPQVMVKITGASKGMVRLRSHLTYVTKNGKLPALEDDGTQRSGRTEVQGLADEWRVDGSLIPERGWRREALHITFGMPRGTPVPELIAAVEAVLREEFGHHRWAWVYHGHQASPHLHVVVRAEGRELRRLNPRKPDLRRWRERFAHELRARGIEADASSRAARGVLKEPDPRAVSQARKKGRLRRDHARPSRITPEVMRQTMQAWARVHNALAASPTAGDRALAADLKRFLASTEMVQEMEAAQRVRDMAREAPARKGPEIGR
jgi:hypothetical protein